LVLTFENSEGVERAIAEVETEEDAYREMHKFMNERNFKSYYTRKTRISPEEVIYDVGSWTEFFHLHMNGWEA